MTTTTPPATSGYVDVGRADVYYETHGSGDPLVLLHGAMGTIDSCFPRLLPKLAQARLVIAAELQGHGHTPDVAGRPLVHQRLADDIAAVLRSLDVEHADVVGYSLGGSVGLQMAMTHPELVRRVVFFGGCSYRRDGLHPDMLEPPGAPIPDLEGTVWHRAYVDVAPRPQDWRTLVAKVVQLDRSFPGWTQDALRAIQLPTLLIIGDADIVRPEHAVEMFRLLGGGVNGDLDGIPRARLGILPGTSHIGVLDRVDSLCSMITDFL